MPSRPTSHPELPRILWLWVPVVLLAVQYLVRATGNENYGRWIRGERALIENLTVLFLAVGLVAGLLLLIRQRDALPFRWMVPWLVVMCLGTTYFMGEEASWGQHWFGWDAPESIAEGNKQDETNFHNNIVLERYLDHLPRNILSIAVFVGGVVVPLVRRVRPWSADSPRAWLWPTMVCFPAAAVASFVNLPERLCKMMDVPLPEPLDIGTGETEEWALGFVIMAYLLSLRARVKANSAAGGENAA